jgi:diguanylate cyclase (GGDEF)-like protein/PAS domain S-box-containing protein
MPFTTARSSVRRLSRLYVLGLGVIALCALARARMEWTLAGDTKSSGETINLVGRQRFLAEHVALTASSMVAHANSGWPSPADGPSDADRRALDDARADWRSAEARLRVGTTSAVRAEADEELRRHLVQLIALTAPIDSALRELVAPASKARAAHSDNVTTLRTLERDLTAYVGAIDRLAEYLAAQQHQRVTRLQRATLVFTAIILLLLVGQGLFIFRPAVRALAALMRTQHQDNERLAEQAESLQAAATELGRSNARLEQQQEALLEHHDDLLVQQRMLEEQRESLMTRTRDLMRLSAIMDATPDPVAVYSVDGSLEYANAAALALLGRKPNGSDWREAYRGFSPWAARQLRDTSIPYAVEHGVWQGESSLRAADGTDRPCLQTVLAHYGSDGAVRTLSSILHDITQLKSLQLSMAGREAHYRAIIDSLAEGVVVQDHEGRIVSWNQSAERVLGMTADEMSGRTSMHPNWQAVNAHDEPMAGEQHPIVRARIDGEHVDREVMGVHTGAGELVWLSVNARPMFLSDLDDHAGAVATFSDITEARAIARELETMSIVAQQSDYAVATMDALLRLTWANSAWEKLTGYTLAEVKGHSAAQLAEGPQTSTEEIARRRAATKAEISYTGELLNYRKDGAPYWRELTLTPIKDAEGAVTGWVSLSRDVTARRAADRERHQLAAALAVTADGIAITGVSGALEFVNHAFARMHVSRPEQLIATPWSDLYEREESQRLVREAMPSVTSVGFWQGEATGRRADGAVYPQELSLTLLPGGGLVAVARDVTERQAVQEKLRHLSLRDELTGLYNRRGFMAQALRLLELAERQGRPCALLYGDLDRFKLINDRFGHGIGDAALVEASMILATAVRATDLVARIGGDEFILLAYDAEPDGIAILRKRIDDAIAASNASRGEADPATWQLGLSLGAAYFDPATPLDVEALLKIADAAQYQEKAHRRTARAA